MTVYQDTWFCTQNYMDQDLFLNSMNSLVKSTETHFTGSFEKKLMLD